MIFSIRCRRLQIHGRQQHDAGDDDQRGNIRPMRRSQDIATVTSCTRGSRNALALS